MDAMPEPTEGSATSLPKNIKKEEILIEWQAPARPYKPRNREYYTTIASLIFLCAVILILLKEFLLTGVIIAIGFLSYVLASVPPETTHHQLTTKGIRTANKLFEWETLTHFWLESKWNQEMVIIRSRASFPGLLILILEPSVRETILKHLGDKLPLDKPEASFVDRASRWLQEKVPLENN